MPDSLLITKLRRPTRTAHTLARPRLTGLLESFLQAGRPLILVSAPAGFGKTSLLSEWIPQSGQPVTWLGLDEEDNDPTRFWIYFIAALQGLRKGLGENARAILEAREPPSPPNEAVLTDLLNEIAAFPDPFVLLVEDYHLINTPAIHSGLTFLTDHLPEQMHLVLTSRSDPPLPLARWRAGGRLAEIRADDLRFTQEEAFSLLVEILRLPLSTVEVTALIERTEGWIAGLQLAALSMQGRQDLSAFIADFTGSHHYIVDYLTEEILQRQPEKVQKFLMFTSILERMCASLCETVTGQSGCQEMLENLERANLFLQPLDDERHWYRYHQLFAEMLRHHLRQAHSALIPELQHNASLWYEQSGLAAEAIRYALEGKDFERAASLVEANADTIYWRRGEIGAVFTWLEALPDDLVRRRPRLCLLHAWTLLMSGRFEAVEPRLQALEMLLAAEIESDPEAAEIKGLRGQIAAIRARLARMNNDLPRSIELCRQALEYIPRDAAALRGVISLNLGLACWQSGDIDTARQVLAETSTIREEGSILSSSLAALAFVADLKPEQGHLHQAARIYQQVIEESSQADSGPSPVASWAYVGMGRVLYQWNDLDESGHTIENGLELARRWGNTDGLAWANLHLAQWKAALGLVEEAAEALAKAGQTIQQSRVAPWTAAEVSSYQGETWIAQGRISEAVLWAQERGLKPENEVSYLRLPEYLSFARLLLEQGRWGETERLLVRMQRLAEKLGLTGRIIEIFMLQAFTFQAQEKSPQALEAMGQALSLAEPEGYLRLFSDEGEKAKLLIDDFRLKIGNKASDLDQAQHGKMISYVGRLLQTFRSSAPSIINPQSTISNLITPLSERELEILRLLADGLSNREIARRSYITDGTVKAHLKHIFRKLDVGSRTEAASRARQLNLL